MIDRDRAGDTVGQADRLAELHRELTSVQIRERASFAAELRAELEGEWLAHPLPIGRRRLRRGARVLAVAAVVALLALGLSAPRARAALSDVIGTVQSGLARMLRTPDPDPSVPHAGAVPPPFAPPAAGSATPEPISGRPEPPGAPSAAKEGAAAVGIVFPDLLDRAEASRFVEGFYPDQLDGSGIGGTVGLRIYVDESGTATEVQVIRSSGVRVLDSAAADAAPSLRFKPAQEGGEPVGSWVELGIDFSPRPYPSDGPAREQSGGSGHAAP